MNTRYKIALAVIAGAGLGAAAIEGLHAQAKPPTYVVVAVRSIKDADGFKAGVVDKATPGSLAAFGGRYVVRTQTITSFGGKPPERFVLLAFDSPEKATAWHEFTGRPRGQCGPYQNNGLAVVHGRRRHKLGSFGGPAWRLPLLACGERVGVRGRRRRRCCEDGVPNAFDIFQHFVIPET